MQQSHIQKLEPTTGMPHAKTSVEDRLTRKKIHRKSLRCPGGQQLKQCVSVLKKAKYAHQEWCCHHMKGANYSPLFRTKTQLQFIVQSGALKHHINPEKLEQVQHDCQDLLNMTYKNRQT